MGIITSANLANAIVKLVAADALPALMGNMVMGNLVNRDFEPVLANAGDTVNVPIPPVLVANNIAEGGTVNPQNPNLGNAQIVLNTHAESTFQIPDVTKALAFPELLRTYMQPAVVAIAAKVEQDLLNLPVTEAVIDSAETALFAAKVPPSAPKYLVVDSNTYSAIRQIPRFSEYYTAGEAGLKALVEGNVGKMKDFFIFRSQYVPVTGAASPTIHNLAFSRNAIGLVVRRLPQPLPGTGAVAEYAELGNFGLRIVMSYQPNTLAQQFTVDVLYGCGVLRNNFAVQISA
jgi:P22 coat protein - gene protein 5